MRIHMNGQPGQIEARDVHIWWNRAFAAVQVLEETDERWAAKLTHEGYTYATGAACRRWRNLDDAARVREMTELAITLMVQGFAPAMVMSQFAKVRQFLRLGAESSNMCQALSQVIDGCPGTDTAGFESRFLAA